MLTKECTKCGKIKDATDFFKCRRNKHGLSSSCKQCNKEYYKHNKEHIIERVKQHTLDNKEHYIQYKKEHYSKNKEKLLKKFKNYRVDNKNLISSRYKQSVKYTVYAHQLTILENPRLSEDGETLEVLCKLCNTYFAPTRLQVKNRINALKGRQNGESNLYCSDKCKRACSTYGKYAAVNNHRPTREVQVELRVLRFEIDNNECQVCFSKENLQCHHYEGIELNPIESADLDKCVTICKSCHRELHKIPGYTYKDYKRKNCKT